MPPKETKSPERNQNVSSKLPKPKSKSKSQSKSKSKPEPESKASSSIANRQPSSPKETPLPENESTNANNGPHIQSAVHNTVQTQNYSHNRNSSFKNKSHSSQLTQTTQPDNLSEANNANERAAISRGKQIAGRWLQNWEGLWLWLEDADTNAEAERHITLRTSSP